MQLQGHGNDRTRFDVTVRQTIQDLRRAIVRYLTAASDVGGTLFSPLVLLHTDHRTESELTVVLAPVFSLRDDRPSGVAGELKLQFCSIVRLIGCSA